MVFEFSGNSGCSCDRISLDRPTAFVVGSCEPSSSKQSCLRTTHPYSRSSSPSCGYGFRSLGIVGLSWQAVIQTPDGTFPLQYELGFRRNNEERDQINFW